MQPPEQITPRSPADYLEVITREPIPPHEECMARIEARRS
jgi:hypothetical protein